ncbi:MAG: 2,3-bisphosphoglycerate-independent phosphoglycerate mutase, partial [Victivallales bacterium]|nr:2,3-bisphosphoglycerate-independent phosphoglycerate mutase [Victivallales bacterium]
VVSGSLYKGDTWREIIANCKNRKSTLHFLGLFSDGNVHSNINHLKAMLEEAKAEGIAKARIHILLDGRDVPATSALDYVDPFEGFLATLNDADTDYRIASGGGRMTITMDRYGANWDMVRKGWETHVHGNGVMYPDAHAAITALRAENPGILDQDLPPFVISADGKTPVGAVADGDAFIFFNFRGDRSQEITLAFDSGSEFDKFDRGRIPQVIYAGMMEYDPDLHIPKKFLVSPPQINRTLGEYLCACGEKQLAISETQKFGHVTYFFNGNRSGKFDRQLEDYVEIPSDIVPFEERPWMKSAEITDQVAAAVTGGKYGMIRLNYPNGDMVGHTGNYQAVLVTMGALDIAVRRVREAVRKAGGILVISADHGNADDMYEHDKNGKPEYDRDGNIITKTSHSLNPVPCIIYDPAGKGEYKHELRTGLGISSLAATCMELLGYEAPDFYDPSVLIMK